MVIRVERGAAKPARIVHHVPGRLRIKVQGAQDDAEFFRMVQQLIGGLSGVESVRVNPASSSIVVQYPASDVQFHARLGQDEDVGSWIELGSVDADEQALGEVLSQGVYFLDSHSRLAESIVMTAEYLDASLRRTSHGVLDLKVLVPLGVVAVTALHKARGRGTPMWVSVGSFAFNAFLALHRRRIGRTVVDIVARPKRGG